jgi:hypothetical protein
LSGVGDRAKVTYISRLQAVQASIESQLASLAKSDPKKRVLLVTFNGDVTIVGDGSNNAKGPVVITGDKLKNEGELERLGREYASSGSIKPIGEAKDSLTDALFALEETGPTALGPALVVALAIASGARGSQVIVCTDGVANVGVGSIDTKGDRDAERGAEEWYRAQGLRAREQGTRVDILSIKGDECRLELLGHVAAETLGSVTRVDPTSLGNDFAALLANPVLATNVTVTFLMHEGLQFRNEDAAEAARAAQQNAQRQAADKDKKKQAPPKQDDDEAMPDVAAAAAGAVAAAGGVPNAPPLPALRLNKLVREVGNVTRDSEVYLEYGLRSRAELAKYADLKALPFQAQIRFTTLAGMTALRVLTQAQSVTLDRAVAEQNVKIELLSAQVASKSAQLARDGRYKEARRNWISSTPLLARAAAVSSPAQQQVFSNYAHNIDQFDRAIAQQQRAEKAAGGNSDDDDDEEEEAVDEIRAAGAAAPSAAAAAGFAAPRSRAPLKARSKRMAKQSDEVYQAIHKTHQLNSAGLL